MSQRRPCCPKCQGQLYLEDDTHSQFRLPPEWTCLQCGWRRSYTPRQFAAAFALSSEATDDRYASDGVPATAGDAATTEPL